eukprot:228450-Chlamydomonas_euryale.AAC.8
MRCHTSHSLALVAVAQLHRLVYSSGRAARHRGAVHPAVGRHVGLHGGIAARVDDLAAHD